MQDKQELLKGTYKGIDVRAFEHNRNEYFIEPDEAVFSETTGCRVLEKAGFVEYLLRWYKVIQKDDDELVISLAEHNQKLNQHS